MLTTVRSFFLNFDLILAEASSAMEAMTVWNSIVMVVERCDWPQCLQEESFGPVVGIQKVIRVPVLHSSRLIVRYQVSSDEEAIALMNDSHYGLTASVWTNVEENSVSEAAFLKIVDEVQTGTVFLNRYDDEWRVGTRIKYVFLDVITWIPRWHGQASKIADGESVSASSVSRLIIFLLMRTPDSSPRLQPSH